MKASRHNIDYDRKLQAVTIAINGPLDHSQCQTLHDYLHLSLEFDANLILLDLSNSNFIVSKAAEVLINFNEHIPGKTQLAICCPNEEIWGVISFCWLTELYYVSRSIHEIKRKFMIRLVERA